VRDALCVALVVALGRSRRIDVRVGEHGGARNCALRSFALLEAGPAFRAFLAFVQAQRMGTPRGKVRTHRPRLDARRSDFFWICVKLESANM
jgi:hypothetical protein